MKQVKSSKILALFSETGVQYYIGPCDLKLNEDEECFGPRRQSLLLGDKALPLRSRPWLHPSSAPQHPQWLRGEREAVTKVFKSPLDERLGTRGHLDDSFCVRLVAYHFKKAWIISIMFYIQGTQQTTRISISRVLRSEQEFTLTSWLFCVCFFLTLSWNLGDYNKNVCRNQAHMHVIQMCTRLGTYVWDLWGESARDWWPCRSSEHCSALSGLQGPRTHLFRKFSPDRLWGSRYPWRTGWPLLPLHIAFGSKNNTMEKWEGWGSVEQPVWVYPRQGLCTCPPSPAADCQWLSPLLRVLPCHWALASLCSSHSKGFTSVVVSSSHFSGDLELSVSWLTGVKGCDFVFLALLLDQVPAIFSDSKNVVYAT